MKVVGFILITLGMLFMFAGMTMDTTANYSDTLNIGLLNDQTNRILIGVT